MTNATGHDDELKIKLAQSEKIASIVKIANTVGSFLAYVLIVLFIYAAFTV